MRNIDFKKNLELVYPTDKRRFEIYMPWVIIQRIISIPFFGIGVILRISPNLISLISILLIFVSSYLILIKMFLVGMILLALAVILDCVDGEVARVLKKTSVLGERLEALGADLVTMVGIPSISIWMFLYNELTVFIVFFSFISASIYVFSRGFLNFDVQTEIDKLSFWEKITFSQSKYNVSIREKSFLGSIIFFLKMNLVTQDGIVFFSVILIGIFVPQIIIYPVIVIGISQLFIGISTIFVNILDNGKLINS
jgi:phosphatidylglycerophosphate synthase